jgi:hypothetical protein
LARFRLDIYTARIIGKEFKSESDYNNSMAFGIEGEKIRLVPLDKEKHLANAVAWMNDEEVTRGTLVGDVPMTRDKESDWFDSMKD